MQCARRVEVFREGAKASDLYEVLDGAVIVSASGPKGRRQILDIVGRGNWFGMTSGPTHASRAETLTPAVLRKIDRAGVACSKYLNEQLSEQALARLDALHAHAMLLGRTSAMERIAAFLLQLSTSAFNIGPAAGAGVGDQMAMGLKQRDIGDYLGLKVETVSRKLAILKKRTIIAKGKDGQFRLLDVSALRRLANLDAAPCPG
ncbi:MAG: helix-turn-helix domain-containing protein [Hyphomicrobium sp.]